MTISSLILVDQRDMSAEEALHLVAEPSADTSASTAVVLQAQALA